MKPSVPELGRVVLSKQGHDKGKAFIVVGLVDDRYVLIADGETRKLEKPKKKQVKHLIPKPELVQELLASIRDKAQTADSDIRKALKTYRSTDGNIRPQDKEDHTFV